jgi:TetR/AcrR family transcriptional repressor of nem operon
MNPPSTRAALLDLAQDLSQTRGFNAFSYRDLAGGIGIRTASIHHHFPTKADLGREMMARYRERFREQLASVEAGNGSARRRLKKFADLFRLTLRQGNRLCLCGMLATEYATLPPAMQREVKKFYQDTEAWLARILEEGRAAKEFSFVGPPEAIASAFFAALEGAMIAARTFDDESRLAGAAQWFLFSISAVSGHPRSGKHSRVRMPSRALAKTHHVVRRRRP